MDKPKRYRPRCRCTMTLRPDGTCPGGCPKLERHLSDRGKERRAEARRGR